MPRPKPLAALALLLFTLLLLAPGRAFAQTGVVVRLENTGAALAEPVKVSLENTTGDVVELELRDDGSPPDVAASDQNYSGATLVNGDTFKAVLSLGGKVAQSTEVTWPNDGSPRDLIIVAADGAVTLEARTAGSGAPGGPGGGSPNAGVPNAGASGSGSTPVAPTSGQPPAAATFPDSSGGGGDGLLFLALGVGLIVVGVLGWLWYRGRQQAVPASQGGALRRLPEPPLLGGATPSVSDGLSLWVTPAEALDAFVGPMLRTLALRHRVLVVAPARFQVPPVFGGPVYQAHNLRPVHVGDTAEELSEEGGLPLVVLVLAEQIDAEMLGDYGDLVPPDVGVVVVTAQDVAGSVPRVSVARTEGGWTLAAGGQTLSVVEREQGLAPA